MQIDISTAKELANIVLIAIAGSDALQRQLPFEVDDYGDMWLVRGTPATEEARGLCFVQLHIFLRKSDGEICGLGESARQIINTQRNYLEGILDERQLESLKEPILTFMPWTDSDPIKRIYLAHFGGLINKPDDAVSYAYAIMQSEDFKYQKPPKQSLHAEERDSVWHVTVDATGSPRVKKYSRYRALPAKYCLNTSDF